MSQMGTGLLLVRWGRAEDAAKSTAQGTAARPQPSMESADAEDPRRPEVRVYPRSRDLGPPLPSPGEGWEFLPSPYPIREKLDDLLTEV